MSNREDKRLSGVTRFTPVRLGDIVEKAKRPDEIVWKDCVTDKTHTLKEMRRLLVKTRKEKKHPGLKHTSTDLVKSLKKR